MRVWSLAYWATFAAQLVAMPAFGIGSALWLSSEARQHREEEMRSIQIEMASSAQQQQLAGPTTRSQADGILQAPEAGGAISPGDASVLPAAGPDALLKRLVIYQGGAFLAGLIGEFERLMFESVRTPPGD